MSGARGDLLAAAAFCLVTALAGGCGRQEEPGAGGPVASGPRAERELGLVELRSADSPLGRARERLRASGVPDDFEVLSVGPAGEVLYGRPILPARPDADPAFQAELLPPGAAARPVPVGTEPLIDAAVCARADGAAAIVTARGELLLWRPDAAPVALDREVSSGLSCSARGDRLAYAKGMAPELDVYVVDLGAGGPGAAAPPALGRAVAPHPAPDYLPALSADGREVLFVSSRTGIPALWVAPAGGGEPRQITNRGLGPGLAGGARRVLPVPDGRAAPLWRGELAVYFDGAGVRAVDLRRGEPLGRVPGARRPHWLGAGERAAVELSSGAFAELRLAAPGAEP